MEAVKLWLSREAVTEEIIKAISRVDGPATELRYYEALQDQFAIMVAEGGRRANGLYWIGVWVLPKVMPGPGPWALRLPMIALWALVWKKVYFFGSDVRVHFGLPKLLREMQATGQTSLARKASVILQKYT
jgi:hypothetical protein